MLPGKGNKTSPVWEGEFIVSRMWRERSKEALPEVFGASIVLAAGTGYVNEYSVGFLPEREARQALRVIQGGAGKLRRTANGHRVVFLLAADH